MAAADELAAERPEIVSMPASGLLIQSLVQQLEQERREQLDDLLADGEVLWQAAPGPRPLVQVWAKLL